MSIGFLDLITKSTYNVTESKETFVDIDSYGIKKYIYIKSTLSKADTQWTSATLACEQALGVDRLVQPVPLGRKVVGIETNT